MSKIVRLTESDLVKLVKRVVKEQSEMGKDPFRREGGGDFDYFGKIIVPQMKQAGFRMVDETKILGQKSCPYYCCKYFVYPDHNTGINLVLQCGDGVNPTVGKWEITVYYGGNKGIKNFSPGKNGAQQAVDYAIQLKNKMYPSKGSMQEQKKDENLMKEYDLLLPKMYTKYSQACKTNFKKSTNFDPITHFKKSTNFPFDPDIKKLQMLWNKLFGGNLKVDGIVGPEMKTFLCFPP